MKIKFDSTQQYQLQSVAALVDLFDGQPLNQGDFTVALRDGTFFGDNSVEQTELGLGNNIVIDNDTIYKNLITIQEHNDLDPISKNEFEKYGLNFTVEMETGTGKTYVYLRTIFELSQKYGFKKFIIVVPSVAIREGVLKNIEITNEHFRALYNNIEFEYFVYDSKKANRLRQFAVNNQLQVMVINIDAFRKDFSDSENERKSNVIFKENDRLSGRKPIEFVQATRPIVIIDEPQSVDSTTKAQEAIKSLNPACIFRFSATHKNLYNQVYKLDPIRAYELRLVKQIVVASVTGENAQNNAYVKLLETDNTKGIRARIRIQVQGKGKVQDKDIWVKYGTDLFNLSNEREVYKNGYEISEICAEVGNEYIEFASQGRLYLGHERGGISEDLSGVQIRSTIKKHLDKEKQLKDKGIKVLSLFFIDKVANYRFYDDEGKLQSGKFFILFEKYYNELIQLEQYKELAIHPVGQIHDGYFSQDKKGILKDTKGDTQADDDTYTKIMRNKEQLLSLEEPLKFIFSHSALREGWDNPNVFQICTLNESQSVIKKRQEIGRGLRLPVNQDGERVFDNTINKLTVIANESYDDFARKLQNEYEEDCGVTFGKVPKLAFKGIEQVRDGEPVVFAREESEKIWNELYAQGFLDLSGKIQPTFKPSEEGFTLGLSKDFEPSEADIITVLQSYELTRHIKKDEPPKILKLNKQVFLDPDFEILWNKINRKTTYQVVYSTPELIENCVEAIYKMDRIEPVRVNYREAELSTSIKGVRVEERAVSYQKIHFTGNLPDILAYLQKYTELTRKTLVEILTRSERIKEFAINPQRFMDQLVSIINRELHKLMIDGIKYEKLTVGEIEWSMQLFKDNELREYLEQCIPSNKSVYDRIIYDSEIEKKFAQDLERRSDIKLFVKLPAWFKINTPIGQYNPDWAIVKHDDDTIYMVRETKGTKDFEKLRNSESEKIRCGRKHFEALGADFEVVTSAQEV